MSLPITTITKTFVHVMRSSSGSSSGSLNKYNPMNGRSKWDANQPQACDVDCEQVWVWNTLEICNNLCIVCALHAVQRVPFFPLKLYITHTGHIEGFSIFIDRIQEFEENWKVSCALWWGKWFFHHNVMTIRFKVINSTLKSRECKSFNDARANHIGYLLSLSLSLSGFAFFQNVNGSNSTTTLHNHQFSEKLSLLIRWIHFITSDIYAYIYTDIIITNSIDVILMMLSLQICVLYVRVFAISREHVAILVLLIRIRKLYAYMRSRRVVEHIHNPKPLWIESKKLTKNIIIKIKWKEWKHQRRENEGKQRSQQKREDKKKTRTETSPLRIECTSVLQCYISFYIIHTYYLRFHIA